MALGPRYAIHIATSGDHGCVDVSSSWRSARRPPGRSTPARRTPTASGRAEDIAGLVSYEGSLGEKWLQLLTEIAPGVKRAAAIFNPDTAPVNRSYYLPSFEQTARSLKVEPITALVHSDAEIAAGITSL